MPMSFGARAMSRICGRAMSFAGQAITMFLNIIYAAAAPDSAVTFNIGSFMDLCREVLAKLLSSNPARLQSRTLLQTPCAPSFAMPI